MIPGPTRKLETIGRTLCAEKLLKVKYLKQVLPDMFATNDNNYSRVIDLYIKIIVDQIVEKAEENAHYQKIKAAVVYPVDEREKAFSFAIKNLDWIHNKFAQAGYPRPPPPPIEMRDICVIL